jgi:ubiquinone/menaquinone biosynthesis C-methylase UbiE/uncharacterized protein YbaR (Trm112 family)
MMDTMLEALIDLLACPWCAGSLRVVAGRPTAGRLIEGELGCVACGRVSVITDGVWMAMGPYRPPRTLAQMSNVVPPVPQLYERVWRKRSLSLLSGRRFPLTEELRELCDEVKPDTDRVIVDVACSEGTYARCLAERGSPVLAVDHSAPFLRRLSQRARRERLSIAPVRALAQHLPIQSGSVRAVVMGGSLNEIGDQDAAAAEMVRILGHEGRLFSMSLVQRPRSGPPSAIARTRAKVGAATASASGVVIPTEEHTVELFERAGLVIDGHRRDGSVLRIAGERK